MHIIDSIFENENDTINIGDTSPVFGRKNNTMATEKAKVELNSYIRLKLPSKRYGQFAPKRGQ